MDDRSDPIKQVSGRRAIEVAVSLDVRSVALNRHPIGDLNRCNPVTDTATAVPLPVSARLPRRHKHGHAIPSTHKIGLVARWPTSQRGMRLEVLLARIRRTDAAVDRERHRGLYRPTSAAGSSMRPSSCDPTPARSVSFTSLTILKRPSKPGRLLARHPQPDHRIAGCPCPLRGRLDGASIGPPPKPFNARPDFLRKVRFRDTGRLRRARQV